MLSNIKQKTEKRLLNKKDFLIIASRDPDLNIDNLKKMKVNELRELFKLTHEINGQYKNYKGFCYSCLSPLKSDFIRFENYCLDC